MGCVLCDRPDGFLASSEGREIVAQAQHVARALRESHSDSIRNIVMMGMGEPLHNFEPVMDALEILTDTRGKYQSGACSDQYGRAFAGIQKLARHPARYSLAVSLHGASDEERGKLVPINQRWPLADLSMLAENTLR